MLYKIIQHGNPALAQKALPVDFENDDLEFIRTFSENLVKTSCEFNGAGIAANQVGFLKRVFAITLTNTSDNGTLKIDGKALDTNNLKQYLINPIIVKQGGKLDTHPEACMSIRGAVFTIQRPDYVEFTFQDIEGNAHQGEAEGYAAFVVQHEIDHLDGVTIRDLANPKEVRKQELLLKRLKRENKSYQRQYPEPYPHPYREK